MITRIDCYHGREDLCLLQAEVPVRRDKKNHMNTELSLKIKYNT